MKVPSCQLVDNVTLNGLTIIVRASAHVILIVAVVRVCQASGPTSNRKTDVDSSGNDQIIWTPTRARIYLRSLFLRDPFDLFCSTTRHAEFFLFNTSDSM